MNNKPTTSVSRKQGKTSGLRSLIFAAAITSTLALWALFSKIERNQASSDLPPITSAAPAELAAGEINLNLPPIPTLIPSQSAQTAQTMVSGAVPTQQPALVVPQLANPVKIKVRDTSPRLDRPPRSSNGGGGGGVTRSSR